ncbi:MAG: hypothetical protein R2692_01005 [Microbacterium sp.]
MQNRELTAIAVDCYSATGAGPLQHFWSLCGAGSGVHPVAAEVLAVIGLSRRCGWDARRALCAAFAAVFAASLAYSIVHTANHQEAAYFSTLARLWEFAFGSLLALAATARGCGRAPGDGSDRMGRCMRIVSCRRPSWTCRAISRVLALWPCSAPGR